MIGNNRTRVIVMGLGSATERFVIENQDNDFIDLIGLIIDSTVAEKEQNEFASRIKNYVDVLELSQENLSRAEIIFAPEYRKIIPDEYCDRHHIVNCHGGVLPKWRGFALMLGQ